MHLVHAMWPDNVVEFKKTFNKGTFCKQQKMKLMCICIILNILRCCSLSAARYSKGMAIWWRKWHICMMTTIWTMLTIIVLNVLALFLPTHFKQE